MNPILVALAISVAANAALGWAFLVQRDDTTEARTALRDMEGQRDGVRQVASACSDSVDDLREHQMHAELIAVGVVPTEDSPEPAVSDGPREPVLPTDRTAAINAAFEKIALRNERTDFTSNGSPHAAVIAKELGWSIGGKERDLAWQKFSLERSGL